MALKFRKDYVAPHYELPLTELDFTLHPTKTIVKAKLHFEKTDIKKPIILNGQYMKLNKILLNGEELTSDNYVLTDETLTIYPQCKQFLIETEVEINPQENTRLMGLYMSNGIFCTQCEPEGFRNITYYPDHSDVPSKYIVTIHADRKKYPVLLSNGNVIRDDGDTIVYEDPYNKPCYLFALVAGNLDRIEDTYTTGSGKKVDLRLFCEKGKSERLTYAMDALKRSMAWDEKVFNLEYDLNRFSIVAVPHFNAGAMENKSLNIFNDAALLASPDTATDATYEYIEHVVAHEYFHNYSGDRVTLRSWFELSLKEGFTVFRDSEYGYDTFSRAVARIDDVATLRAYQFPEDDGPLAHPVRPDSYHEIDNFYTTTIYEKGAEVIRMQKALVGNKNFARGCALYFKRHDGQAVTIDDFVKAIEDASKQDLTKFKQWYSVPGRPKVRVKTHYEDGIYTIKMSQKSKFTRKPFVIPMHYGLVGKNGEDLKSGTLVLERKSQTFTFDVPYEPALSLNRFFTSPIDIELKHKKAMRLRLMKYDSDLFNRYDVGHQYALDAMVRMYQQQKETPDMDVIEALGSYLTQKGLDKAFIARAIVLPTEEEMLGKLEQVDIKRLKNVREVMRHAFAEKYETELLKLYQENHTKEKYIPDSSSFAKRAIKNVALGYLALTGHTELVKKQFDEADNLTDRIAALGILVNNNLPEAQATLNAFYKQYENEDLVLNKWFALQARNPSINTLPIVKELVKHPKFDIKNPNKVRGLIGAFSGHLEAFHTKEGYEFFAEQALIIDKINPHLAARLFTAFSKYRKFDAATQTTAKAVLTRLAEDKTLSNVSRETIERML